MNTTVRTSTLLLELTTEVTCPGCQKGFSLRDGFAVQSLEQYARAAQSRQASVEKETRERLEATLRAEQEARERKAASEIERLQAMLAEQSKSFEKLLKEQRELDASAAERRVQQLAERLQERDAEVQKLAAAQREMESREKALAEREAGIEQRIATEARARAEALAAEREAGLQQELESKRQAIRDFQAKELELREAKRRLEEERESIQLQMQRKLDEERVTLEETIAKRESEKARLKEAEFQKKIEDMKAKLEEAQRRAEQGSQQLQGEVLELALEGDLRALYPMDTIAEVKKGARGGDVVQTVTTRTGVEAGKILWEAKRAANFGRDWPAKLKEDQRAICAEIGVIVTTAMPKDFPATLQFGQYEDVWVTSPAFAPALAQALRQELISAHKQKVASANRGEKADAVYDYLTSPQFANKLKAVYGVFDKLRSELEAEKAAMQQRWARREKQLSLATTELIGIAGDIQGLAQQELPQLDMAPESIEGSDEAAA